MDFHLKNGNKKCKKYKDTHFKDHSQKFMILRVKHMQMLKQNILHLKISCQEMYFTVDTKRKTLLKLYNAVLLQNPKKKNIMLTGQL